MTGYGLAIFDQHAKLLEASAIDPDVARARGYVSADSRAQLQRYGFEPYQCKAPSLIIPLHRADGSVWGYQHRPDTPRTTKAGNVIKYETPSGQRNDVDIPPGVRDRIGDPSVPLFVTEGSRKADSAVSAGLVCVSLNGVSGSRRTNGHGGKVMAPGWLDIALNGRRVIMAFDSDVTRKVPVQMELRKLAGYLESKGALVEYLHLPDDTDGKAGLDDYLAASGVDGLWELVRPDLPALTTAANYGTGTPLHSTHTRTPAADQPKQVCKSEGCASTPPVLAGARDILADVVATVGRLGVTGEERIVRGTYLAAVSQVLGEPVSVVVKGASAGGKSYSTRTALMLVPAEDTYCVTAGSQRSLIYTDEQFTHRTIVMFEATALREVAEIRDGDMTAMLVRTLLSEGRIIYEVAERGDDGKTTTRVITKDGPTNLIVTTTAGNLHLENETRLLSLTVDESEQQTREVLRKIAGRRNRAVPEDPPELESWHQLFHWVKHHAEHRVYIPYAGYLAESAVASVVRMRRDFGVLPGVIEASAVLHQATRKRDSFGRIIATSADYAAARDILAEAFAVSSGRKVKDSVRKAITAVRDLGGATSDVLIAVAARYLKVDRTVATRALREAADLGYVTNMRLGRVTLPGTASVPTTCPTIGPPCPRTCPRTWTTTPMTTRTLAHPHSLHTYRRRSAGGVQVCKVCRGGWRCDRFTAVVLGLRRTARPRTRQGRVYRSRRNRGHPVSRRPSSGYQAWYRRDVWTVVYLPDADQELGKLPGKERAAIYNAVRKLESIGPALGHPHTSDARGAPSLRELRPRAGNSPWRPLYRRVGDHLVIAAIAPEADGDPRGFRQACERALQRLAELEERD